MKDNNGIQKSINYFKGTKSFLSEINLDGMIAHNLAIKSLEKQLPKKVTRDSTYSPALCPTCLTDEICKDLGDGHYKYLTDIVYCSKCGQLLEWW